MKKILLVTSNMKKLKEIVEIFKGTDLEFLTLNDLPHIDIVEDGKTFFDNALKKAKTAADRFGMAALGEDSGLVVDVLGGNPGVYSHRFAGANANDEQNNRLLLQMLKTTPLEKRTAHFVSCVVVYKPNGRYITADGRVDGLIIDTPKGDNGFGYDPIFFYPPLNKTFAELANEDKNNISHRKLALEKIKHHIVNFLEQND